jgi:cytochrome b
VAAIKKQSVLVWDMPVRVFHWLLAISFAGAWLTSESEYLQIVHYAFGYSACVLILFRLIWGFVGSKYARFAEFIKGPTEVTDHLKSIGSVTTPHHIGHNPAGGWVMLALMGLILLMGLSGYWIVKEFFADWMSELHEVLAIVALALVVIHVFAALAMSFLQRENLVRSMVTGHKQGTVHQSIQYPMYFVGVGLAIGWAYAFYLVVSGSLPWLTD